MFTTTVRIESGFGVRGSGFGVWGQISLLIVPVTSSNCVNERARVGDCDGEYDGECDGECDGSNKPKRSKYFWCKKRSTRDRRPANVATRGGYEAYEGHKGLRGAQRFTRGTKVYEGHKGLRGYEAYEGHKGFTGYDEHVEYEEYVGYMRSKQSREGLGGA